MNENARYALAEFAKKYRDNLVSAKVADLGSLNLNGSATNVIGNCTGFDIVPGPGVDVVIEPGLIPPEHKNQYDVVISTSSFQTCPDSQVYKKQIVDLLKDNGLLFLTMCSNKCRLFHSSSENQYGFVDTLRDEPEFIGSFFGIEFEILEFYEINTSHSDYILIGKLKPRAQPV